jgi:hypothetical protein
LKDHTREGRKPEWGGMAHSIPPNFNVSTLVPEKPNTKKKTNEQLKI